MMGIASGPSGWRLLRSYKSDKMVAVLNCPICHRDGFLDAHDIAPDGTVSPSVQCFYDCGFHTNIKLLDYAERMRKVPEVSHAA